jgi:hypothetical protein
MVIHRRYRRIVLAIFIALLLAVPAAAVIVSRGAGPPPVPVLSDIEGRGGASLGRDCGYSQPLPASAGRSLWLFCDTPVYARAGGANKSAAWGLRRFISGSTAAVGRSTRGHAPGRLTELATPGTGNLTQPGGAPAPFLPAPTGLQTPAGLPCDLTGGAYAASWITGAARIPSSPDLLITFNNYCVLTGATPSFLPEGFGLVEYNPATNTLSNQVTVFPGIGSAGPVPSQLLGSPVFAGPYLYLFGPTCSTPGPGKCSRGRIFMARVAATPLAWANPLAYQWWTSNRASPWTLDPNAAGSIIPGARPSAVNVQDFAATGHGLVLIEQTDISGRFVVYGARSPVGRWARLTSGRVPCRAGGGYADFCRAIIGHPELSTRTRLYLSYFNPAAPAHGHVMVKSIAW